MTRFELATPRPPDAYSNRTELHPELCKSDVFPKSDAKVLPFSGPCKHFRDFFQKKCVFGCFCPLLGRARAPKCSVEDVTMPRDTTKKDAFKNERIFLLNNVSSMKFESGNQCVSK